jgi:hypothetical protein
VTVVESIVYFGGNASSFRSRGSIGVLLNILSFAFGNISELLVEEFCCVP